MSGALAAAPEISFAPPAAVVPGSLGILGGTFDPVHHGHLAIAEEAREALGLERVLLVPTATPPHKPGRPVSAVEHRLAMLELASAPNPAFSVNRIEIDRGGRSYTVDTLEALARSAAEGASADLTFILSAEALAELPTWREPRRILRLCRLAVVPREGYPVLDAGWMHAEFPGLEDRVRFLPGPLIAVSGSTIRRRAAARRSVRYLVPDAVASYIADHALYTDPAWREPRP